ncbi:hypothetical protein ACJGJ0_23220 (plasmid) [Xanthomonas citri pv. mangiferaeindicae]|uniref:hypothetical protein n=1 Tax=Xanthomonas TaxID=338 RepID=UPI00142EEAFB|nr:MULTISPECIES: hypothetical protein [Xanthomonas]
MSRLLLRRLLIRGSTGVLLDNIFARLPTGTCDVEASHIRTPVESEGWQFLTNSVNLLSPNEKLCELAKFCPVIGRS